MAYQDIFYRFADLGAVDVFIPFILIFTIVFAVLQKIKLFGKDSKRYNVVIGLVMGLSVVFPHVLGYYPPEKDIVLIINQALPNVSIVIVAIVMALLVIGVFGARWEIGEGTLSGWVAIMSFLLIIYIFGAAANWWYYPGWLWMMQDPETVTLVITILVFAIIIWFITKEEKEEKEDNVFQKLGKAFSEPLNKE
ncbi:hypothetical protein GOV11_01410 [Candidatus Woesearchaeota archaeon]|nr:hypothetical protein [Candidatus Woesearchaeota archaeon]